jgi:hypothetical protein
MRQVKRAFTYRFCPTGEQAAELSRTLYAGTGVSPLNPMSP